MVTYYKLAQSLIIVHENKPYNIGVTDERYAAIQAAIDAKDLSKIPALLNPSNLINHPDFQVQEGLIHYRGQPLPTVLSDEFLKNRANPESLIGVANFWFNLRSRAQQDQRWDLIIRLIKQKGYSVTEDGFTIVYEGGYDRDLSYDAKIVTPFYNYSQVNATYRKFFEERQNLTQICQAQFGFVTKKLLKLVKEAMFPVEKHYVKDEILNLGVAFKGILSPDNLFSVIESKKFPGVGEPQRYTDLNFFFKELSKNKDGTFSEKKILNLVNSKHQPDELIGSARFFKELYTKKPFNLNEINMPNDVAGMYRFLAREHDKLKNPEYDLEITKAFPSLEGIDNTNLDGLIIKLPKTNYDLKEWSRIMSNCIHSYDKDVKSGSTIVMAVVNAEGKMLYNIEINGNRIQQFVGQSNSSVRGEKKEAIINFLLDKGIIISKKS